MNILDKFSKNDLVEFINDCSAFAHLSKEKLYDNTIQTIQYYKSNAKQREQLREYQKIEKQWFNSLKKNKPDYSVYDSDIFLSEAWSCWNIYSRRYLLSLRASNGLDGKSIMDDMGDIKSIADLGCGIGYTTAALKQLFPKAKVYGTNVENSTQWKIAQRNSIAYKYTLVPHIFINKKIDFIFASEYFEHIENAVEHMADIVNNTKPKYLIIANSFGTISVGHFINYKYEDRFYDGKATSRIFNNILGKLGYEKVKTRLWNNRPMYWRKKSK